MGKHVDLSLSPISENLFFVRENTLREDGEHDTQSDANYNLTCMMFLRTLKFVWPPATLNSFKTKLGIKSIRASPTTTSSHIPSFLLIYFSSNSSLFCLQVLRNSLCNSKIQRNTIHIKQYVFAPKHPPKCYSTAYKSYLY